VRPAERIAQVEEESVVSIFAWIVVGFVAGAIAKFLMPGKDPGGFILTGLIGIGGALLGGFIAVALGISNGVDDFDFGTIVLAVLGALLILFIYRMIMQSRDRV
jgi:uncharacterized membrane protein YeaQ/YmgE (transglycosylase-associated protein family)